MYWNIARTCTVAAPLLAASIVSADTIYETADPFGGAFGLFGFDVFEGQSVAVRFTPDADYTLDQISLWFMNNDDSGGHPEVTVTLRNDNPAGGESVPGDEIIETWTFNVSAVGWDPQLETMVSKRQPLLHAGTHYWIAAESDSPPFVDGVWNVANTGVGFVSTIDFFTSPDWQPGGTGGVVCTIVEGTLVEAIEGDVDGDGDVDFSDLLQLLAAWGDCPARGVCPADLDRSGGVGFADLLILLNSWTG